MADFNIEDYIKDIPEDLQEQARKCSTPDELLKFAGEKKIPLPDDALEAVAGGCGSAKCEKMGHQYRPFVSMNNLLVI